MDKGQEISDYILLTSGYLGPFRVLDKRDNKEKWITRQDLLNEPILLVKKK